MRFVIDRCDICKADYDVQFPKPVGWITWKIANLDEEDVQHEMHFCSEKCLRQYLLPAQQPQEQDEYINVMCKPLGNCTLLSFADGKIYRPVNEQEQSACKARRFLLIDEAANITEGVKWSDGRVQLETAAMREDDFVPAFYKDWKTFKQAHEGSGVQWIDQEVAE